MKKKIIFIINPLSGGLSKKMIPAWIEALVDKNLFDAEIAITKSEAHTLELAAKARQESYDAAIAVGGDGTLNNIARYLAGSETALGIIPMGSGNGFARELGLPMNTRKAIQVINGFNIKKTDTGTVNGKVFINVCGVGFDAMITGLFADSKTRGLKTYARLTLQQVSKYKPQHYKLIIDGAEIEQDAFVMTICNGTQFGNNAFIAPGAKFDDGIFNITAIEDFKWHGFASLGVRLFTKKIHQSKKVKTFAGASIKVIRDKDDYINIDGEPVMMDKDLEIVMKPLSLKVIVP